MPLKLRIISMNFFALTLFLFFLCLGSQNLSTRHKINLLINETVELPNGFIIGFSFAVGFLGGTLTSIFNLNKNLKDINQ
tara:strand:- start:213 stop:452 length:240 start_codon:yes stop_codon:yes gene_type:complete